MARLMVGVSVGAGIRTEALPAPLNSRWTISFALTGRAGTDQNCRRHPKITSTTGLSLAQVRASGEDLPLYDAYRASRDRDIDFGRNLVHANFLEAEVYGQVS